MSIMPHSLKSKPDLVVPLYSVISPIAVGTYWKRKQVPGLMSAIYRYTFKVVKRAGNPKGISGCLLYLEAVGPTASLAKANKKDLLLLTEKTLIRAYRATHV